MVNDNFSRTRRDWGAPATVCETIGEGRILQCVRAGGPWPAHLRDNPPAVEARCTACDAVKAAQGVLDQVKAEWERRQLRSAPPGGSAG